MKFMITAETVKCLGAGNKNLKWIVLNSKITSTEKKKKQNVL